MLYVHRIPGRQRRSYRFPPISLIPRIILEQRFQTLLSFLSATKQNQAESTSLNKYQLSLHRYTLHVIQTPVHPTNTWAHAPYVSPFDSAVNLQTLIPSEDSCLSPYRHTKIQILGGSEPCMGGLNNGDVEQTKAMGRGRE